MVLNCKLFVKIGITQNWMIQKCKKHIKTLSSTNLICSHTGLNKRILLRSGLYCSAPGTASYYYYCFQTASTVDGIDTLKQSNTISHKKLTNAHIYHSHNFINTVSLRHVSAHQGPSSVISWILHLTFDIADEMYLSYSLKTALWGLKLVEVTQC